MVFSRPPLSKTRGWSPSLLHRWRWRTLKVCSYFRTTLRIALHCAPTPAICLVACIIDTKPLSGFALKSKTTLSSHHNPFLFQFYPRCSTMSASTFQNFSGPHNGFRYQAPLHRSLENLSVRMILGLCLLSSQLRINIPMSFKKVCACILGQVWSNISRQGDPHLCRSRRWFVRAIRDNQEIKVV